MWAIILKFRICAVSMNKNRSRSSYRTFGKRAVLVPASNTSVSKKALAPEEVQNVAQTRAKSRECRGECRRCRKNGLPRTFGPAQEEAVQMKTEAPALYEKIGPERNRN